jgi:bifunctional non-homologous end joining protein LigD
MHLTLSVDIARVAPQVPIRYVVFDLLWLGDQNLLRLPYLKRRELLNEVVEPGDAWLVPAHHVGGAADLLEASGVLGQLALHAAKPHRLVAARWPSRTTTPTRRSASTSMV